MGCFGFAMKRKVPENRTPENSFSTIKSRPGSSNPSSTSLPPSLKAPSSSPKGPLSRSPSLSPSARSEKERGRERETEKEKEREREKESRFGGRPQPLPAPILPASPSGRPAPSIRKNSSRSEKIRTEERDYSHGTALSRSRSEGDHRLQNSEVEGEGELTGGEGGRKERGERAGERGGEARSARATNRSGSRRHTLYAFRLVELEAMTRDFAVEGFLGEGGFGSVYRGAMGDMDLGKRIPVAVKVLNIDGQQGETEWLTEVTFLGLLHHQNLVRLIGYCAEGDQRLLVYEFLSNGSLEHALFHRSGDHVLGWSRRMKIALGAARGLAYLHEEAEHQVIYRDFKTSNILLDKDYEAKLSDFGLARSGPEGDKSHVTTRVVGTVGYAAPEYIMTGHLTTKSDVWGFGVVLLELLTGRVSMDKSRPREEQSLVDWALPFLVNPSKLHRIMDPSLAGRYSVKGAQLLATLILNCLDHKAKARPKMSDVVLALLPIQDLHDMAGFTMEDFRVPSRKRVSGVQAAAAAEKTGKS